MVTLDEVRAEAKQLDPADVGRLIATVVASILYAVVGWLPARIIRLAWVVLAWSFAAVKLGWRDGWSVQRSRA